MKYFTILIPFILTLSATKGWSQCYIDPSGLSISKGQTKLIDMNGDGTNDVSITCNSIGDGSLQGLSGTEVDGSTYSSSVYINAIVTNTIISPNSLATTSGILCKVESGSYLGNWSAYSGAINRKCTKIMLNIGGIRYAGYLTISTTGLGEGSVFTVNRYGYNPNFGGTIRADGECVAPTSNYGVKDGKVEWIFLQINDVYEIAALSGGKQGGMARVATLKKELLKENPNTYATMSGDFLNPSVIGTLKHEGEGIKGKQMVEVMNAAGIDLVCLGNHEFDLDFLDLQKRINESNFEWISTNAFHAVGNNIEPFARIKDGQSTPFTEYKILEVTDGASGEKARIGLWGVVIDGNRRDYVQYSDVFERSNTIIENILKKQSDVIVGMTHLNLDDDKAIAAKNPSVALLMGGHEHENSRTQVGNVLITKADANAITAYVHRFSYDLTTKQVTIESKLVAIDDKIVEDPATAAVVKKWTDIADKAFKVAGFTPNEVVAVLKEDLDGRSVTVRTEQNNMGAAIVKSMVATAKSPLDCAFFNSGSVRIDDWVHGTITQVDIIRIMPYGGKLFELDITGAELRKTLTTGVESSGRGGYLQWYNITYNPADKSFKIKDAPLDDAKTYRIMLNDYLVSTAERIQGITNIDKPNAADTADLRNDIRKAFIDYLKKQ